MSSEECTHKWVVLNLGTIVDGKHNQTGKYEVTLFCLRCFMTKIVETWEKE